MRKKIKFINCNIDVSRRVFAPRIETEFWVKKALGDINKIKIEVLDIFAGSGCIGIAILKAVENATVCFIDSDKEAIKQIKINLKLNKIPKKRYRVYKSDLFEKLVPRRKYDFILANPPYVATDRIYEVQKGVLEKEPHAALFAGKDGMFYIEGFLSQIKKHLKPAGKIFMEFDPLQKPRIEKILNKKGFKYAFKKDQFAKLRWLKAEAGIF